MQTRRFTLAVLASAAAAAALLNAFGQGSLTPPAGPAGPTMRTLTQVEPRIPLAAGSPGVTVNANGGFTITAPGAYYLTSNLTVATGTAIIVSSGRVAVDLMGFTLASTNTQTASGFAVQTALNADGIVVRNGFIHSNSTFNFVSGETTDSGFFGGIDGPDQQPDNNITVSDLTVTGISGSAIRAVHTVERCRISSCRNAVASARLVRDCWVEFCRDGVFASDHGLISHCRVSSIGTDGTAISASQGTVAACTVKAAGVNVTGIDADDSVVTGCQVVVEGSASSTTVRGIRCLRGQAVNCRAELTGPAGSASVAVDCTDGLASQCFVKAAGTGATHTALRAKLAEACVVSEGGTTITNRYNMP